MERGHVKESSRSKTFTKRRTTAFAMTLACAVSLGVFACSGADEGDEGTAGEATPASQFFPGDPPAQPSLPPGAGPRPPTPPRPDSGGGRDSSMPPADSGPKDATEPSDADPE